MDIQTKLREQLVLVLGLKDISQIQLEDSIVLDLGADSLDFVELVFLIEKNFGVALKMNQIFSSTLKINAEDLFKDGLLTMEGATLINKKLKSSKEYKAGMSKVNIFSMLSVKDLATIIEYQLAEKKDDAER